MSQRDHARILIYSHDSYGLGRLRRCLAVANALVGQFKGLFVLIISGAQVPTGMGLRARVDFVKIPSVIKLYDGQYTSMEEHIDLRDTMSIRQTIIRNTAESFEPDLMIVDDEPFGLTPEVQETLDFLKRRGCTIALALPDLIDVSAVQSAACGREEILAAIDARYDQVWVYGAESFARPFDELGAPKPVRAKVTYTGYLRRNIPRGFATFDLPFTNPYILVTADDGAHGFALMDRVLTAYENDATLPHPALLVLSPLVPAARRKVVRGRAVRQTNVRVLDFEEGSTALMPGAVGVITTAGYDAFCQMLSFDKRTIFVTNGADDACQDSRAQRAAELNLAHVMTGEQASDPHSLSRALHAFANRPLPSQAGATELLGGLETICAKVEQYIRRPAEA